MTDVYVCTNCAQFRPIHSRDNVSQSGTAQDSQARCLAAAAAAASSSLPVEHSFRRLVSSNLAKEKKRE